jgi:hypothetical protein
MRLGFIELLKVSKQIPGFLEGRSVVVYIYRGSGIHAKGGPDTRSDARQ